MMSNQHIIHSRFKNALFTSEDIKARINDETFCSQLYGAMCNTNWYEIVNGEDGLVEILKQPILDRTWSATFRTVGGYVADIRNYHNNTNEDYLHWYCSAPEGVVTDEIRDIFHSMGWKEYRTD